MFLQDNCKPTLNNFAAIYLTTLWNRKRHCRGRSVGAEKPISLADQMLLLYLIRMRLRDAVQTIDFMAGCCKYMYVPYKICNAVNYSAPRQYCILMPLQSIESNSENGLHQLCAVSNAAAPKDASADDWV